MDFRTRTMLSSMMFLQFFIWGAWFVTLGTYLGRGLDWDGIRIGAAYSTMPWGALLAPLFVGMVADRFFRPERVLAVCHLFGGILLFQASFVKDPTVLFWVLFAYALTYNPTLALVNSIAFRQMKDTGKEFPSVRVWGTLGWIASGLVVGTLDLEATSQPMRLAAVVSLLLAVLAFLLSFAPAPESEKTAVPAGGAGMAKIFGLEALGLMKDRAFAFFAAGSLLICIPLAFYYNFTNLFLNSQGVENAAGVMTLGQVSEILFMLAMPYCFGRLGVKNMLLIGMAAWAARYILFACGASEGMVALLYVGIVLHGVCYDFFFVTGQIYVDRVAPRHMRASAQGFITLLTYGLGMLIGSWVSGWVVESQGTRLPDGATLHQWPIIWLVPAAMAVGVFLLFLAFFHPKNPTGSGSGT
jgi:nucleoside transporter